MPDLMRTAEQQNSPFLRGTLYYIIYSPVEDVSSFIWISPSTTFQ
nr:MAG TPA: hypothetical protein [Caudoviricetes sp.]